MMEKTMHESSVTATKTPDVLDSRIGWKPEITNIPDDRTWTQLPEQGDKNPEVARPQEHISPKISEQENDLRCSFLPKTGGEWEGERGDGKWKPNPDAVPPKQNPEEKTWEEILSKYGIDGIEFKDGEPDFSPIAEETIEIDDFTTDRTDNFSQADQKLADKWNSETKDGRNDWTAQDIAAYRKENGLTWHERGDMKTMDLVPSEVHNNIPHAGGISTKKSANA